MAVPMQSRKGELKRNTIEPTFAAQEWPAMPRAAITVAELECGAYTVKPRYEKKTHGCLRSPGDAAGNFDGTQ